MQEIVTESFRLSPQQRHLCTLQSPGQEVLFPYRTQIQVRLDGTLDIPRLRRALEQVIDRHEILRTTIAFVPGFSVPRQIIASAPLLSFTVHDLRDEALEERDKILRAEVRQHQQFLYPSTGPVVQVTLLLYPADEQYLLLDLPALNGDGITGQLLLRELGQWYAEEQDTSSPLEEPFQYADLAEWQHELLTSTETSTGRAYWREAQRNAQAEVQLPYAQHVSPEAIFEPETLHLTLSSALVVQLDALAGDWEVSRSTLALLCWSLVLGRLTEQSAVLIGTGFQGRRYAELAEALGLLATYLPLTYHLSPDDTCRAGARRMAEQVMEAQQWQEYFSWEYWKKEEEQGQEPYPAFGFDYTELPSSWLAGSLRFQIQAQEQWVERFTVRLACCEQGQELQVTLCYDRGMYTPVEMQRLLGQWQATLSHLLEFPQSTQADTVALSAEEWEFLQARNATRTDYFSNCTLHQLFTEQAKSTPEAVALLSPCGKISFWELEERANQVAWRLRGLGVGPEVCVGICLGRSIEMVVGLLGILKAGGAYVPLDPATPAERLARLVQEAHLSLVLTQEALQERFSAASCTTLCLDRADARLAQEPSSPPSSEVSSANLAYVLYTSGSTGVPKGVMVSHRSLLNYVQWSTQTYEVSLGSGTLLHSSLCFDLTITALFPPLLAGRCVTLLSDAPGIGELAPSLLASTQLSLLKLTPTHLDLLRHSLPADALDGKTRALVIGGEALSSDQVRFWQRHAPHTRLFNEYGPTETVVGCCVFELPSTCSEQVAVPIGTPIANTRLYVLDPAMHLVPLGVAGELYIAGKSLSRGYLHQPERTAERFVPDPFASEPGGRLYRTGDRVRMRADGTLLFLGRLDQQVKIHGYRIEPGEIEAALRQHPAVREVVVLAQEDQNRLVAYVVADDGQEVTTEALRLFLQSLLPEYMLPGLFVPLTHLPVTANGKLDRQALPAPEQARLAQGTAYVAPRTLEEEVLAGIWSQVLGVARIGIDDNYFALGGDSIRSIQVVSSAQERGLSCSVEQVFRFPTIRSLAHALLTEHTQDVAMDMDHTPFALVQEQDRSRLPVEVEDAYPLTMLQGGMLFHNEYSPGAGVYHDIFSYHIRLFIDLFALEQAVQALVERHPVLRTAFDLSSYSEPLQLVYRHGPSLLTVLDVQEQTPEQQESTIRAWIAQEKQRGFDWSRPPLLRIHIHVRSATTAQFTLSFHHAIIDGWSDATLLTELFTHYFALVHGQAFTLAPPMARYRDFVALERAALASQPTQDYWDRTLAGGSFTSIARWPRQGVQGETEGVIVQPVPLSESLSEGLKQLALTTAVPIKNVLLAAHLRVLSLLSGQQDVTTCVVSGGRPEGQDGERVLGLFINSIPFRLNLQAGTWQDLVTETFRKECEALPYRRYPMAELKRRHGGLRLSETLFYFTHYHILRRTQQQEDLEVLELIPHEISSFSLSANFWIDPFTLDVHLRLRCTKALFSEKQIEALAGYYSAVLTAMATAPEELFETRDLLLDNERTHLLQTWNATHMDYPQGRCFHQLFEEQVNRTPELMALNCPGAQLSYRELDERANQLAYYLRRQGVELETRVGICMERSQEMIVGLLGILKAGGAYVPLDPNYPAERLAFFVQDAGIRLVLTRKHHSYASSLPDQVIALDLETQWNEIAKEDRHPLENRASAANLAYVLYTSGTTGVPKGVMISQANLVNYLYWANKHLFGDDESPLPMLANLTFDACLKQVLAPLLSGSYIWMLSNNSGTQSSALWRELSTSSSIRLNCIPALWTALLDELQTHPELLSTTRLTSLYLSGDALHQELVSRTLDLLPDVKIWNIYGPTEATANASWANITSDEHISIGRPLANTQIYVLDRYLNPVPIGTPGELYIAGAGLARGYLNRPEFTAERFIPNPFNDTSGGRLYRTGDRARYLPDGTIEYLGRVDHQIKIRGFRVEPEEIEVVLKQQTEIKECVVIAREDVPGDQRLIAYIVAAQGQTPQINKLRAYLKEKLPFYMIPAAFVQLDALPVMHNGKLDRAALPEPDQKKQVSEVMLIEPRTDLERTLTEIWTRVLRLEKIGVYDNFFDLGGHSLLATTLISRVRETFKVALPLRALFDTQTIAGMAEIIERGRTEQVDANVDWRILAEVEGLSDEEIDRLLEQEESPDSEEEDHEYI